MATIPLSDTEEQLDSASVPIVEDATDAQLLELFISQQDELAFAELVKRHSAMVLGVCRRILHNPHDAEDCFQAAFLVLVRKAASIWPREMVGNWLYGVAYRTALEARKMAARRRTMERKKPTTQSAEPQADLWEELRPVLDQEVNRLPDKYRAVLVLCDLEGKTRTEAAEELKLPEGTVASRLARARTLLTRRLSRYSLTMSTAVLADLLAENAAQASPDLIAAAASLVAGKQPVSAVALADRVGRGMLLGQVKTAAATLLLLLVLAIGVLLPLAHAAKQEANWHLQADNDRPAEKMQSRKKVQGYLLHKITLEKGVIHVAKFNAEGDITRMLELVLNEATRILIDGRESQLSDLRNGQIINVEFEATAEGKDRALQIHVVGERVEGVVLSVSDQAVTVQMLGQNQTENRFELDRSGNLVVMIARKQASVSDLQPGMHIQLQVSGDRRVVAITSAVAVNRP